MGWFGNLFKKKKTLEEVKTWLEEEQKKQVDEQGQATDKFRAEFPELLTGIQKAMTALEKAELRNPSIPERAKHYMVGKREQLLKLICFRLNTFPKAHIPCGMVYSYSFQ